MDVMCFHCRESRLCHLRVGTGLGILLLRVESVFARRRKEYLSRALLPPLGAGGEKARVLDSATIKFNSWLGDPGQVA